MLRFQNQPEMNFIIRICKMAQFSIDMLCRYPVDELNIVMKQQIV